MIGTEILLALVAQQEIEKVQSFSECALFVDKKTLPPPPESGTTVPVIGPAKKYFSPLKYLLSKTVLLKLCLPLAPFSLSCISNNVHIILQQSESVGS